MRDENRSTLAEHVASLAATPLAGEALRSWAWRAYEASRQMSAEAYVRLVLAIALAGSGESVPEAAKAAIRCTEAWLACPCASHAQAAWEARSAAFAGGRVEDEGIEPAHKAAGCAAIAAYLVDRQASFLHEADAVWFAIYAATKLRPIHEVAGRVLQLLREWRTLDP